MMRSLSVACLRGSTSMAARAPLARRAGLPLRGMPSLKQPARHNHQFRSVVTLTSERHPEIKRGPFARLTDTDFSVFRSIIGSDSAVLVAGIEDLSPYNVDWMGKYRGQASVVLKPRTTAEVSAILKHCYERGIAVVPQGGNTGLVGGSVPVFDEVVISTSNMSQVQAFDEVSGILTCQAGCVLEVMDNWLAERGFMMPLDLGAKGSCQIGGNVATNAGGLRLLRYGSLHGTVLALEVALPDGRVVSLGQPLRKDNTGFDLKHLFIGGEGTLGVITSVSILVPRRPSSVNVAVLKAKDYASVQRLFQRAKGDLSEILSAFEFWDASCSDLVMNNVEGARGIFSEVGGSFSALIETSGSDEAHDGEKLSRFLEAAMDTGTVEDGALADSVGQRAAFWQFRESISPACGRAFGGGNLKYDLSVPVPVLYDAVTDVRAMLEKRGLSAKVGSVVGFGHMGDGNLHLNVTGTKWDKDVLAAMEPYIYEWVRDRNGSISAEHGLGLMKAPYVGYSKSADAIEMMRQLKTLWDPKGIMNPYKFLPN